MIWWHAASDEYDDDDDDVSIESAAAVSPGSMISIFKNVQTVMIVPYLYLYYMNRYIHSDV